MVVASRLWPPPCEGQEGVGPGVTETGTEVRGLCVSPPVEKPHHLLWATAGDTIAQMGLDRRVSGGDGLGVETRPREWRCGFSAATES